MRKIFIVLFILTIFSGSLFAQDIKFNAQVRYRAEFDKNGGSFNSANFQNAVAGNNFELFRTRLGMIMDSGNGITGYIQFQDSRNFGEEYSTLTDATANSFDLHQGFIHIENIFDSNFYLKLGRMELILGNERLVGAVGWSNTGRAFDGALLCYHGEDYNFKFFQTKIRENTPSEDFDPDEYFTGAWYSYTHNEIRKINLFSFMNFDNGRVVGGVDDNERQLMRFTTGFDYTANHDRFDYEVEAAYQMGKEYKIVVDSRQDVAAYMFAAKAHYKFDHEKNPYIGLGVDYLSGDDNSTDSDLNTFNTLYATNHKYYGYMDYFTNIPSSTFGYGLRDIFVTGGLTLNENAKIKAGWHYFNFASEDYNGNSYLGNELDITYMHNYRDTIGMQFGGSFFLPGDVPKMVDNNDKAGWWYYAMLTYNFNQN
ncbi:alginate export family protein [candidate division KSB1 bacterium]